VGFKGIRNIENWISEEVKRERVANERRGCDMIQVRGDSRVVCGVQREAVGGGRGEMEE